MPGTPASKAPRALSGAQAEVLRFRIEHEAAAADTKLAVATELASTGLKSLTLAHGGALVAMFTLVGQGTNTAVVQRLDSVFVWLSFAAFAAGLALALGANIVGYWSQQLAAVDSFDMVERQVVRLEGGPTGGAPVRRTRAINRLSAGAVMMTVTSLFLFIAGSGLALYAVLPA